MSEPTEHTHTLTVTVGDYTWETFAAHTEREGRRPGPQIARFLNIMAGTREPYHKWLEEVIHCAFLKDGPGAPPKMDPQRIYLVARGKAVDVTNRFYKAG